MEGSDRDAHFEFQTAQVAPASLSLEAVKIELHLPLERVGYDARDS